MKRILADLESMHYDVSQFQICCSQGSGGQATVMSAVMTDDAGNQDMAAVKNFKPGPLSEKVMREILYMVALKSDCILPLKTFGCQVNEMGRLIPILVTPLCQYGSLTQYFKDYEADKLTPTEKTIIAYGICHALRILHRKGILHRDMKPENIFIDDQKRPVLGDFGFATFRPETLDYENPLIQSVAANTPFYQAPEMSSGKFNFQVDIYGYAMILWVLIHEEPLTLDNFENSEELKTKLSATKAAHARPRVVVQHIENGNRVKIDPQYEDEKIVELMKMCWYQDPKERPRAHDICEAFDESGYWKYSFSGADNEAVKEYIMNLKESDDKKEKMDLESGIENPISVEVLASIWSGDVSQSWEAFQYVYRQAQDNDPTAMMFLSLLFHNGYGCDKDEFMARKYIKLAIETSDSYEARAMLDVMNHNKTEFSDAFTLELAGKVEDAWKIYSAKIAEGSVEALTNAGMMLIRNSQVQKGFKLLEIAAKRMSPVALYMLGCAHKEKAEVFMKKAAELGHKAAQVWLTKT